MKKVGEFLKEKREAKELTLRDAAKMSDISHVNIMQIEEGQRSTSFDRLMRLLRTYMVDVDEFLRETGYLPVNADPAAIGELKKIPVVSWVIAGKWEEVANSLQHDDAEEWIDSDVKGQNVFALRVRGDSMEPEFYEDDIIIVNPHIKPDHGDFIVVVNYEGEATFKQLKKYGKTRMLHPLNPKYPDIELSDKHQYRIIGKVVKKEKRY